MSVKFYEQRTVQKGKGLPSMERVTKRLLEIKNNKQSAYHKPFLAGQIQVHQVMGSTRPRWDIIQVRPVTPPGSAICGECSEQYFNLNDDYLCEECRIGIHG
jgi:hypothetical protein